MNNRLRMEEWTPELRLREVTDKPVFSLTNAARFCTDVNIFSFLLLLFFTIYMFIASWLPLLMAALLAGSVLANELACWLTY